MKRNAESISLQLRKGYYTTTAINKALDKIDNVRKQKNGYKKNIKRK